MLTKPFLYRYRLSQLILTTAHNFMNEKIEPEEAEKLVNIILLTNGRVGI